MIQGRANTIDDIQIHLPESPSIPIQPSTGIPIHPSIGSGIGPIRQRVDAVADENLPEYGYCSKKFAAKALKITFFWSGFAVSLGAVATAIATYTANGRNNTNSSSTGAESDSADSSGIANIVVTGATTVFTFMRECYNYWEARENKKEAFIEKTTREQLEKERYEELHQMLAETAASLRNYERNKNTANFQGCLQTIRNLPEGSKSCPPIRDEWLSKLIAISDTQKELQEALKNLEGLGKEIQETNQAIIRPMLQENKQKGTGESSAQPINTYALNALSGQLDDYQKNWQLLVNQLGFCPQSLSINGFSYSRDGNVRKPAKEVRIKVD